MHRSHHAIPFCKLDNNRSIDAQLCGNSLLRALLAFGFL